MNNAFLAQINNCYAVFIWFYIQVIKDFLYMYIPRYKF